MATNDLSTKAKICDAALALLRQDVGYSASSSVAAKCDNLWSVAWENVASAHKWSSTMSDTPGDTVPTDKVIRSLLVYSVARELAIPITGRQEDLKTIASLFADKTRKAIVKDLETEVTALTGDTKEIASELVRFFCENDSVELPFSLSSITGKITGVLSTSQGEVRKTLGLANGDTLDALASAIVVHLVLEKIGPSCGMDANVVKMHAELYERKVLQFRKLRLDTAMASETDSVLAQLMSNFKGDDVSMCNAYSVYTQKKSVVMTKCTEEVVKLLGLTSTPSGDKLFDGICESMCAMKLAPAIGIEASFIQLKEQEVEKKVLQYRKLRLDTALASETDVVLSQLLSNFSGDDAKMCNAYSVYTQKKSTVYTACQTEVNKILGLSTAPSNDGLYTAICETLCVAKLALACGVDAQFAQAKQVEYEKKVLQYRKLRLDTAISTETDTILSQLVANSNGDDASLCNSYTVYTQKKTYVFTACKNEVKALLGLTSIPSGDSLFDAASEILCVIKLAPVFKLDVGLVQLKEQEFERRIAEWRKMKLNDALKNSSDKVLLNVLSNFKSDDAGLANAFDIYTTRSTSAKELAESEMKNVHKWRTTFTKTSTTHVAYPAFVELASYKILSSCSADANVLQSVKNEYDKRVQEAISADLEDEMHALRQSTTDSDKFAVKVLDVFRQYYSVGDATQNTGVVKPQPRGIAPLVEHINSVKDDIRTGVLLTHDWSFAKREVEARSYPYLKGNIQNRYETLFPADAVKIIKCYGLRGNKIEAFVKEGDKIITNEQVDRIVYLYDDGGTIGWSPLVVKAYVYKVAASVCLASPELTNNSNRVTMIENIANTVLNEAKQTDSRQSFVGTSAYGRNYLLDVATGRCQAKRFGR